MPAYRYPARIVGGQIRQADNDFSYQISGAVVSSGAIAVTVSKGGQSATGYGRLARRQRLRPLERRRQYLLRHLERHAPRVELSRKCRVGIAPAVQREFSLCSRAMPTRPSRRVGKIVIQTVPASGQRATILPTLLRLARRPLHAAVRRHHIDRRGRDRPDP